MGVVRLCVPATFIHALILLIVEVGSIITEFDLKMNIWMQVTTQPCFLRLNL
jgi:hypothetical protein